MSDTHRNESNGESTDQTSETRAPLLDRRAYLKATGGLTALGLASTGHAAAQQGRGKNRSSRQGDGPEVEDLRVEYDPDPTNLEPGTDEDAEPPRFSWSGHTDDRSSEQGAYQIRVSSTPQNAGDVWDSGEVQSSTSTNVPYDGPVLPPEREFYWQVRVWDQNGNSGSWSDTATFSTTIADDDWEGEWIGADLEPIEPSETPEGHSAGFLGEPEAVSPNPLLRKEFALDSEVESARLHISGLGYNESYLNGERISDEVLDPATTDYEETVLFSTYDVTDHLDQGDNAIGIALGRGRLGEPLVNTWYWHDTPYWSDPELLLQLNVTFADGSTTSIVSDESWSATDGPTRYDSLFDGEEYDARLEQPGWTTTSFDDSDWDAGVIVDPPSGDLEPQRTQPVRTHGTVSPVSRSNPEEGVYVFDLGVMIAGWTRITVDGPEGTEVTISMGEKLDDDGRVVHGWFPGYNEDIQDDVYILNGDGEETWESSFTYKGFRYIEIEGFPGTPEADNLEGVIAYTDLESGNDSDFSSSNDLLNQIHENTRRALLNNHHGVVQDTPVYEKNGWTGDAQATAATALFNFDMARFYQKWLRDMRDAQLESGEVPVIVPTSDWSYEGSRGWGAVEGPTPGWDASYFIMPWLMYQYNGDERILEKHYEPMQRYMDWFEGYFDGLLPDMGLGDWVAPGENEVAITAPCWYHRELDLMAKTARVLGHDGEADTFDAKKQDVADAFHDEFYDPATQSYGTDDVDGYVQTSNVLPLAFGMVPDDRVDAVVESLVEDIQENHDGHLFTGLWGTKHILRVLSDHGYHDVAYGIATKTTYPSWGHWIEAGFTALLENWALDSRSRDHHFLGTVDEWFYSHLAGIRRPTEPAFEHVEIAPMPVGDLDSAEARVDSVRGPVESSWELTDDGLALDVTIPWNSTATVRVPTLGSDKVRVRESGKNIWNNGNPTKPNNPGVQSVERDGDAVVVEVGSGEYEFELEQLGN